MVHQVPIEKKEEYSIKTKMYPYVSFIKKVPPPLFTPGKVKPLNLDLTFMDIMSENDKMKDHLGEKDRKSVCV